MSLMQTWPVVASWGGVLAGRGLLRVGWAGAACAMQFQGEWFVLALAGNTYRREHRALLNFYITLFELKGKSEFQVTNSMMR